MRITPINAYNSNIVKNNQNNYRYYTSVINNHLAADTVSFKGGIDVAEIAKIADDVANKLVPFMAETRPYHNKLSGLLSRINNVIGDKKSPVKIVNDFTESELTPLREAANSLLEKVPYKKTCIIAAESDSHIEIINDIRLLDLNSKDEYELQRKSAIIRDNIDNLDNDIQAFPSVKEEVNSLFNQNKELISRLFS